jgi:hypothetical protein
VTIPANRLARRKVASTIFPELGFQNLSHSISSGHALQLVRMSRGDIAIPEVLRDICYTKPPASVPENAKDIIASTELVLLEMSTPIEITYDGYIFNQNRLRDYLNARLGHLGPAAIKPATALILRLQKNHIAGLEDARAQTRQIVASLEERDELLDDIINRVGQRHISARDMIEDIERLRELLPHPIGLVLHNFQYMPDARPIVWPAGFKDDLLAVAKHFDLPTYDPAMLVERVGATIAMAPDLRHYEKSFYEVVADEYMEFASTILGRKLDNGRAKVAEVLMPISDDPDQPAH